MVAILTGRWLLSTKVILIDSRSTIRGNQLKPYVDKERKKAITSTIALLIGWPVALDQFLEGQNTEGIKIIFGWLLIFVTFIGPIVLNKPSVLIFSFLGGFLE